MVTCASPETAHGSLHPRPQLHCGPLPRLGLLVDGESLLQDHSCSVSSVVTEAKPCPSRYYTYNAIPQDDAR